MKYTFLMPAYKAKYLKEAIHSILTQTYQDFRLIVSDDCSPENIKSIVERFDDERIYYRRNERNLGGKNLVEHWNLILSTAKSDYVILAPDDDFYAPTFLEEIDKLVTIYPDVNVLKARVQKIDEFDAIIMKDRVYEEYISQLDNLFHQALPDHMSGIGNYVFKTEALKAIGGFVDYPLAWWSDVMTNVRLSDRGMAITKDILFTMRMSGISITTRKSSKHELRQKAMATMMFYDDIEQIISKHKPLNKFNEGRIRVLCRYLNQWLIDDLMRCSVALKISEAKEITRKYPAAFAAKINLLVFWKGVLFKK